VKCKAFLKDKGKSLNTIYLLIIILRLCSTYYLLNIHINLYLSPVFICFHNPFWSRYSKSFITIWCHIIMRFDFLIINAFSTANFTIFLKYSTGNSFLNLFTYFSKLQAAGGLSHSAWTWRRIIHRRMHRMSRGLKSWQEHLVFWTILSAEQCNGTLRRRVAGWFSLANRACHSPNVLSIQ